MIRICISGLSASGKTSLGSDIAKKLNITHISKYDAGIYKTIMKGTGAWPSKDAWLSETAALESKYANEFDKEIVDYAKNKNCVVTTWLGAWFIKDATLRVWLNASFEERVRRRAKEDRITAESMKSLLKRKDELTTKNFKKVYGIDVMDHSLFDMEINTERVQREDIIATVAMLALAKDKLRFI